MAQDTGFPPNWRIPRRPGRGQAQACVGRRSWSYRVEVLHPAGGKGLRHLRGGDHAGQRVAVSHRLPHGDDVGDEVVSLQLEGPEMAAHTPEAHLDLVGDDDAPGSTDVSAGAGSKVAKARPLVKLS